MTEVVSTLPGAGAGGAGGVTIGAEDPRSGDVRALLETHLAFSRSVTPVGYSFALDVEDLAEPGVTFFCARANGRLVGVGALKRLDQLHAELKSMHTTEAARGRGVGRAMVRHVLTFARAEGYRRVSLETGTMEVFAPARALYSKSGFEPCGPFGDYEASPYNTWMTMSLDAGPYEGPDPSEPPAPPVDPRTGVAVYLEAAEALVSVGRRFLPSDWSKPSACAGWDAAALAGHVLCVVRWHQEWLDRAVAGNTSPPWPAEELAARNQAALEAVTVISGPARLHDFQLESRRYADRLASSWALPYWYPGGLVTTGLHAMLAAGEWHLHAWDLGHAIGWEHTADATLIRSTWAGLGRRIARDGDPWRALLDASGRTVPV